MGRKEQTDDNMELIKALDQLEKTNDISKEVILEAVENSLLVACKDEFGKSDNIKVTINRETGRVSVLAEKTVVPVVEDSITQISLDDAKDILPNAVEGQVINVVITPKNFGRIAAQKAKQVVVQKIREEERKALFNQFFAKEHDIVTGIVQRYTGNNISINLGKVDALLSEQEQVKTERFRSTERIKLYVVEVKDTSKGPRITVSRTHPDLVKRLFESEVTEIKDGTVEIKSISREAGSRTKIAVYSNNPEVDAVGACVGVNRARVENVVDELRGEKIDIVVWSEDPRVFIMNALSPARAISVEANPEEKTAKVIVADSQLSLAIGKEGQNARLAAKLTNYKIDIKSESQAQEQGIFDEMGIDYHGESLEEEDLGYDADYEDADYEEEYEEE